MKPTESNPITIRPNLRIGDLDAETDSDLLKSCFVDNGTLEIVMDVTCPESIILGRTGSGKSALLIKASEMAYKYCFINPLDISVRYLENSNIIQFFGALGIKLDLFYRFLWRHLLVMDLLKLRYDLKSEADGKRIITILSRWTEKDDAKKKAVAYFREWGDGFWLETEKHVKEITEKLTKETKAKLGAAYAGVGLSVEGAKSLTGEQKTDVINKAQHVVSQIQIRHLSMILNMLDEEVFKDDQKRYFILLDHLDEDWASTETRCRFIRALIEEIKIFRHIRNIKILVAMRQDLLELVFDRTRDPGFQQEKYESYLMHIPWSASSLRSLVDKRVKEVFKRQYTKEDVTFEDVFPENKKGGGSAAFDYILERTLYRPRDIMQFVNECFSIASGRNRVNWRNLKSAEANYSQKRLKSLFEEWGEIYPGLRHSIELLRDLPETFIRSQLTGLRINSVMQDLEYEAGDPCADAIRRYISGEKAFTEADVVAEFVACFYKIGAVGVKISVNDPFIWAAHDRASLSRGEIKRINQMRIHKMLHRALGVRGEYQ